MPGGAFASTIRACIQAAIRGEAADPPAEPKETAGVQWRDIASGPTSSIAKGPRTRSAARSSPSSSVRSARPRAPVGRPGLQCPPAPRDGQGAAAEHAQGQRRARRSSARRAAEGADSFQEVRYEGYGPGGVAVMVKCLTDNRNRTVSDVRYAFSKHGGNLGADGSVELSLQPGRADCICSPDSTRSACWTPRSRLEPRTW